MVNMISGLFGPAGDSYPLADGTSLVPVQRFAERRRFLTTFNNDDYAIEFTTALERTKECVWSEVNIVARPQ